MWDGKSFPLVQAGPTPVSSVQVRAPLCPKGSRLAIWLKSIGVGKYRMEEPPDGYGSSIFCGSVGGPHQ